MKKNLMEVSLEEVIECLEKLGTDEAKMAVDKINHDGYISLADVKTVINNATKQTFGFDLCLVKMYDELRGWVMYG